MMKKLLTTMMFALAGLILSINVLAGTSVHLDSADTDINDQKSLQNGAQLFMNYCSGCHSISFMRYNRIGKDLNFSDAEVRKLLMFNSEKLGDQVTSSMSEAGAAVWFGATPPDLSLVARSKGTDWIYSYLRGFYEDKSRPFGVNNKVLDNASMPDVLWRLKQQKSAKEFDQSVRDITNFLDYVGEPVKLIRTELGYKVLGFLFILFILAYLLKKEYWKDVKYGKWRAKK
ncbi:ubiquinol cytochrome C oxidoreductase, cytochrome C1 subunit [uncultured Candidatus Thioglobus sp.]|nr:ubiquinol cytochrome C oxidoreductase, cytochrome C1 subunit [uncultured Candidatus Thioglobus sp.]